MPQLIDVPGHGVVEFPDGMSDNDITSAIKKNLPSASPRPIDITSGYNPTLKVAGFGDTGIHIPDSVDNFLAGAGKAFSDVGTGVGQVTGLGNATSQDIAETRARDMPLMNTKAGMLGNLVGNTAITLPTMAIPGANTYIGAALIGGAIGAAQPTTGTVERFLNMGLGAGASVGGQALGSILGRMVRPVQSSLSPEESRLAQVALDNGIPLSAAELTNSKPLKIVNSVMENMPLTAGSEATRRTGQQQAFNQAVLSRAGINDNLATPDVLAAAKSNIGEKLGDYANNYGLDFAQGLSTKLDDIVKDAQSHLPPDQSNKLLGTINQMKGQFTALNDPANPANSIMPGVAYQGWREPLRQLAKGADATSMYYTKIRNAMDDAFWNQLPDTADAAGLKTLRQQYANLKTVINSMSGNSPSTLAGNVSPAQLGMALSQGIGKEGKALGRGDLNDLVRAGNLFVRPQIPDSGTAQRQLIQSLLTGGAGGLGGAGIAGATGHDPIEGALYGAGITGAGLVAPRVIQSALNSPVTQKYLTSQAGSSTARALAIMLQNSGRTLGMAAIPAMAQ